MLRPLAAVVFIGYYITGRITGIHQLDIQKRNAII